MTRPPRMTLPQDVIDDILLLLPLESLASLRSLLSDDAWDLCQYTTFQDALKGGGRLKHFRFLIQKGVSITEKDLSCTSTDWLRFLEQQSEIWLPMVDTWTKKAKYHNTWAWASSEGYLKVVQLMHQNRIEKCTTWAMNGAAENGHLDVVQWLHENRTEGCTTYAMSRAAENGHLDVVQWLHENRTEGRTTYAINHAARKGHLDVVQWLRRQRLT